MLFTTATFALLFLPLVLVGYYLLGRLNQRAAIAWLLLASLFFYGFWMPAFTLLLLASITINFALGTRISRAVGAKQRMVARRWLQAGLVFNLGLLGYFKYAGFFLDNLNALLGGHWSAGHIILPIGISFYSFTQIAFIVDAYQGKVREASALNYGLFVTYFPHLVAGPVLHHAQMMPQFADAQVMRLRSPLLVVGLAVFALGLVKKVVFADGIAPYADAVFDPVDAERALPGMQEAWLAALAYTLQLYFDFSGYSDMAIGLSWMFNIRLPFNFDSPYKARSISDFWRRWHMTLSAFLRDYLYVALGGNRKGALRRYMNLGITMVLGGLWHGASWSFVIWGSLHGAYLMLNHGWRAAAERMGWQKALTRSSLYALGAWALTLLAVVLAWVFFRAQTLDGALRMLTAMVSYQGGGVLLWNAGLQADTGWWLCTLLAAIALWAPNSNRLGAWIEARALASTAWRDALAVVGALLALAMIVLNQARNTVSAFIYFNF